MKDGKHVFAFNGRGGNGLVVNLDKELASQLTEDEAQNDIENSFIVKAYQILQLL